MTFEPSTDTERALVAAFENLTDEVQPQVWLDVFKATEEAARVWKREHPERRNRPQFKFVIAALRRMVDAGYVEGKNSQSTRPGEHPSYFDLYRLSR